MQAGWALIAATSPVNLFSVAADRDQSALILAAVSSIIRLNNLDNLIEIQRDKAVNKHNGATLTALASDSASAFGLNAAALLLDEVAVWPDDKGERMWEAIMSTAPKNPRCLVSITSNAGYLNTWQDRVFRAISKSPAWSLRSIDSPPPWISPAMIEDQRLLLTSTALMRLFFSVWAAAGDVLDHQNVLDRVIGKYDPDHPYDSKSFYVIGVDLSWKSDWTAVTVVRCCNGHIYLVECRAWAPPKGGEIDLEAVGTFIEGVAKKYRAQVYFDPAQAVGMKQRLEKAGIKAECVTMSGSYSNEMASAILQAFRSGSITLYPDSLVDELQRLNLAPTKWGFKLEAPKLSSGSHCDKALSLAVCLPKAIELSRKRRRQFCVGIGDINGVTWSDGHTTASERQERNATPWDGYTPLNSWIRQQVNRNS